MKKKYGGLKCVNCGSDLKLSVSYDGMSEEAVDYNESSSREWGWIAQLECTCCSRVYPICRTGNQYYISEEK